MDWKRRRGKRETAEAADAGVRFVCRGTDTGLRDGADGRALCPHPWGDGRRENDDTRRYCICAVWRIKRRCTRGSYAAFLRRTARTRHGSGVYICARQAAVSCYARPFLRAYVAGKDDAARPGGGALSSAGCGGRGRRGTAGFECDGGLKAHRGAHRIRRRSVPSGHPAAAGAVPAVFARRGQRPQRDHAAHLPHGAVSAA